MPVIERAHIRDRLLVRVAGARIGAGALPRPAGHLAAEELTSRLGADLRDCWAYSDSENDIPLLELAGNRVVVNPDASLLRHAKLQGWSILRLNKSSIRAARRRVIRDGKQTKNA